MSFNYSPLVKMARRLIRRFGQDGVIRKLVNTGAEDDPTLTPSDIAVKLVEFDEVVRDEQGTRTGEVTKLFYVEVSPSGDAGAVPDKDDRMAVGVTSIVDGTTQVLEITGVMPLNPGGTTLYYEVMVAA